MKLIESFIRNNRTFSNPTKITPRGLMLHSVGVPQPNAQVFIRNWNNATASVSVHAFVDGENTVHQTLPWTNRAWHSGGAANNTHIGVEMTEPSTIRYTSGANFVDNNPTATRAFVLATYATAVQLFAVLCVQFNLNPLADGVVVSHSEGHRRGIASNHADVEHLWGRFGLTMAQFRRDIAQRIEQGAQVGTEIPEAILRVTTVSAPLNCRVAPNAMARVLGQFQRNTLVTATRQSDNWLYVSNGTLAGWSSSDFLTNAVLLAIDTLVKKGVITTPSYWRDNYRNLRFLDMLLIRLSELSFSGGKAMSDVNAAIDVLNRAGVINSPEYWRENHHRLRFVDALLMKTAGML